MWGLGFKVYEDHIDIIYIYTYRERERERERERDGARKGIRIMESCLRMFGRIMMCLCSMKKVIGTKLVGTKPFQQLHLLIPESRVLKSNQQTL